MKTIKMAVTVLMVFGLLAALSLSAHADWFTCNVIKAGPSGVSDASGTRFFLTDVGAAFTNKQFQVGPNRAKEFLAVALTAISQGKKVSVSTTNTGTVPFITAMYVKSQ